MTKDWRKTITMCFDDLLNKNCQIEAFCSGYEKWWNFDRPHEAYMTDSEKEALESVFDVVVVFSSFEDDLKKIPTYKSEKEVRAIGEKALAKLRVAQA